MIVLVDVQVFHTLTHLEHRKDFWLQLHNLLTSFSKRNTLILAGDLNCTADVRSTAVGLPTYLHDAVRQSGTRHSDSGQWLQILKQYDLQALNTWSAHLGATSLSNSTGLIFFKFSCLSHLVPTTLARPKGRPGKEHSRAVRRGLRRRSSRFSVVTKAGLENRQPPNND